jgi:hypothetical protein
MSQVYSYLCKDVILKGLIIAGMSANVLAPTPPRVFFVKECANI